MFLDAPPVSAFVPTLRDINKAFSDEERWFEDGVIRARIMFLCQRFGPQLQLPNDIRKVDLVGPLFEWNWTRNCHEARMTLPKPKAFEAETVLIPLDLDPMHGGIHWMLLVISTVTRETILYNGFPDLEEDAIIYAETFINSLNRVYNMRLRAVESMEFSNGDGWSCGIDMLDCIEQHLEHGEIQYEAGDPDDWKESNRGRLEVWITETCELYDIDISAVRLDQAAIWDMIKNSANDKSKQTSDDKIDPALRGDSSHHANNNDDDSDDDGNGPEAPGTGIHMQEWVVTEAQRRVWKETKSKDPNTCRIPQLLSKYTDDIDALFKDAGKGDGNLAGPNNNCFTTIELQSLHRGRVLRTGEVAENRANVDALRNVLPASGITDDQWLKMFIGTSKSLNNTYRNVSEEEMHLKLRSMPPRQLLPGDKETIKYDKCGKLLQSEDRLKDHICGIIWHPDIYTGRVIVCRLEGKLVLQYITSNTLTGYGMVAAMCEEVQMPEREVPKAMVLSVAAAGFTGIIYLIPILFILPDVSQLLSVANGQPIGLVFKIATGSAGGGFGLLFLVLGILFFAGEGALTAASRCTYEFARDGAIPGSRLWARSDKRFNIPLWGLVLSTIVGCILGCIYFGSSSPFNAFTGVATICLSVSYGIPILVSLIRGRKAVRHSTFSLGRFGYVINVATVCWIAIVIFCMPTAIPVTPTSMNYASVVFMSFAMISLVWYIISGEKAFTGPPIPADVDVENDGPVIGGLGRTPISDSFQLYTLTSAHSPAASSAAEHLLHSSKLKNTSIPGSIPLEVHKLLKFPEFTAKNARRNLARHKPSEEKGTGYSWRKSSHVAQFQQQDDITDGLMMRLLQLLSAFLPSPGRDSNFDRRPPPTFFAPFRLSFLFDILTTLLRNDSIADMTKRNGLYYAVLDFVTAISNHKELDPLVEYSKTNNLTFTDEVLDSHHFEKEFSKNTDSPRGRMAALWKEIANLTTSLPPRIFIKVSESRPDIMKVLIIEVEGTHEGGLFIFDMYLLPEWPAEPPKIKFILENGVDRTPYSTDNELKGIVIVNGNFHRDGIGSSPS
ncbi:hypothetical protein G7Y89_g13561 [Cudoniella acicularis]|uniref:Ubiquitin-like protease family profile domain-containing protein n=1 Tax=Cudoniella acicularis TaxID=354080 RepID=A0A8H4R806_9HELO|nr:hypothetical protein G7Y89_g13561 [Cudoniella acicularis]